MPRPIAIRLIRAIATIFIVLTVVFWAARLSGDPLDIINRYGITSEETIEKLRVYLGLDGTYLEQYWRYLSRLVQGDFGLSYRNAQPVAEMYASRIGNTLALTGLAFLVTVVIGIPVGVLGALERDRWPGAVVMGTVFLGYSIPPFVLGLALILLFSSTLHLLPSAGAGTWQHFVMPVATLGIAGAAGMARFARSAMLDVLSQDYIRSARAKGVVEIIVINKHGLLNAIIPLLTMIGLQVGILVAGSVVVESVFSWPGVGQLLVNAIQYRDFPVIQFGVLMLASTVVFANLVIDLLYTCVDPRIRLQN